MRDAPGIGLQETGTHHVVTEGRSVQGISSLYISFIVGSQTNEAPSGVTGSGIGIVPPRIEQVGAATLGLLVQPEMPPRGGAGIHRRGGTDWQEGGQCMRPGHLALGRTDPGSHRQAYLDGGHHYLGIDTHHH